MGRPRSRAAAYTATVAADDPDDPDAVPTASHRAAVLIPVKAFSAAKGRLAGIIGPTARAELARRMAEAVVRAAHPLPVAVVCDDPSVAAWAEEIGARVVVAAGRGLNGAVRCGVEALEHEGASEIVVAHADLPAARNLAALTGFPGVTLVPDRRRSGTNVVVVPHGAGFGFSYGPGSFVRHQAAAQLTGLPWRILHDDRLAWDVDLPADLPADVASVREPARLADRVLAGAGPG
jgi:2-phospho-L-lactate guanylyltransferase